MSKFANPRRTLPPWSAHEDATLLRLKEQGASWSELLTQLPGRTRTSAQNRLSRLRGTADYSYAGQKQQAVRRAEMHAQKKRAARAREQQTSVRDLTAQLMGDPPPGRSALDARSPDRPRISLGGSAS